MLKTPRVDFAISTRRLCLFNVSRLPMRRVVFSLSKGGGITNLEKSLFKLLFTRNQVRKRSQISCLTLEKVDTIVNHNDFERH